MPVHLAATDTAPYSMMADFKALRVSAVPSRSGILMICCIWNSGSSGTLGCVFSQSFLFFLYRSFASSTAPPHLNRCAADMSLLPPKFQSPSKPQSITMFFSERSNSPRPVLSSCVSTTAFAANAQQVPHGFWSFTGVTHPWSRESHDEGRGEAVNFILLPFAATSARTTFMRRGGGRYPVARGVSSAAHIAAKATQSIAAAMIVRWR